MDPATGTPLFTAWHAPGSEANAGGLRGRTPLVSRPGHYGLHTAFMTGGGGQPWRVQVWEVPYHANGSLFDTPAPTVVDSGEAAVRNVNLASDEAGRLSGVLVPGGDGR